MTQEEKDLVLKDICARLPYGVICQMEDKMRFIGEESPYYDYILSKRLIEFLRRHKGFYIKPYLRQMSSMTKEEEDELCELCTLSDCNINADWECCGVEIIQSHPRYGTYFSTDYSVIDWLNKNMFDYRGLILKDLAISTEVFNPYKD